MSIWWAYALIIVLNWIVVFTNENDDLRAACAMLSTFVILGVWITGVIS